MEALYPTLWKPSLRVICSYWLGLPCGCSRMTTRIYFFTLKISRKIFIVLLCIIWTNNCYWSWFVISWWIYVTDMLWLASWEFLLAVRFCGLGLPRGSSLMTNWIYFSNWKASRKISSVSGSMICPYSCCWSGSVVPLRTCIKDMVYLTYGRLWMAAIYWYYLNLPNSGSCLITVLHAAWKICSGL